MPYRPVQGENILYPWTLDLDLTNFVTFLTALELRIGRHRFFSSIQKINFLVFKEVSRALGGSNKFHPQLTQTSHSSLKGEIPEKKWFRQSVNGFFHQNIY